MLLDPQAKYVTPEMPSGTFDAQLVKNGRLQAPISFDHTGEHNAGDYAEFSLGNETATAEVDSGDTTQISFSDFTDPSAIALPGDMLHLTTGANSTLDVGYGPGRFPVVSVSDVHIHVAHLLTAGTAAWKLIRRQPC